MLKIKTLNLVGAVRVPNTSASSSYIFAHVLGTGHAASGGVDDIQISGDLIYIRKGNAHRIVHVGAALEFELQPGQDITELGFEDPHAPKAAPVKLAPPYVEKAVAPSKPVAKKKIVAPAPGTAV